MIWSYAVLNPTLQSVNYHFTTFKYYWKIFVELPLNWYHSFHDFNSFLEIHHIYFWLLKVMPFICFSCQIKFTICIDDFIFFAWFQNVDKFKSFTLSVKKTSPFQIILLKLKTQTDPALNLQQHIQKPRPRGLVLSKSQIFL